jgi:diguanylate cyclase (GGDEF)-like protein/PAS domain S-box-containing protein
MATLPDGQSCQVVLTDISERRLIEEALRVSEERWKLALDAAGDGVWDWNVRTGDVMFSQRFAQLYGFEGDEYGNRLEDWSARIHPEDQLRVMADIQAHLAGKTQSFFNEHRGHCKDGRWKWVLSRGTVVSRGADGRALRLIGTHVDISNQKKTQLALHVASELQQAVFDALSSHIAVLDQRGHIVQTNVAWKDFAKAQGFDDALQNPSGRYFEVLEHLIGRDQGSMLLAAFQGIAAVIHEGMPSFHLEYSCQTLEEKRWFIMRVTPVLGEQGCVVVSHEDVTRLKTAELANLMLANVDFLTNALSRRHFLDVAEQEFSRSQRYNMPLMVMMLDLDHFKQTNDQYGHDAGDAVLREFVQTVRAVLRESDVIGRLGGEEFAVMLPNTSREGGQALAERVVELVRESPVIVAGCPIHYTVSIGVSCLDQEVSFADLLKRADTALYRAKNKGRDGVHMDVAASPFG